jgi:hypothetical protein
VTNNVVTVDVGGLERLRAAAVSAGQLEMEKLVRIVVSDLCNKDPFGVVDDVLARHVWDEVCWCHQEGPYMDNLESM